MLNEARNQPGPHAARGLPVEAASLSSLFGLPLHGEGKSGIMKAFESLSDWSISHGDLISWSPDLLLDCLQQQRHRLCELAQEMFGNTFYCQDKWW